MIPEEIVEYRFVYREVPAITLTSFPFQGGGMGKGRFEKIVEFSTKGG